MSPLCGSAPCITPYSGNGVYGKSLVNPNMPTGLRALALLLLSRPASSFAAATARAFIHYWRAGSGNNMAINAPFALYYRR